MSIHWLTNVLFSEFYVLRARCKTGENPQQCLAYSEARAYLEMNDWDLNRAVENAVEDMFWSSQHI